MHPIAASQRKVICSHTAIMDASPHRTSYFLKQLCTATLVRHMRQVDGAALRLLPALLIWLCTRTDLREADSICSWRNEEGSCVVPVVVAGDDQAEGRLTERPMKGVLALIAAGGSIESLAPPPAAHVGEVAPQDGRSQALQKTHYREKKEKDRETDEFGPILWGPEAGCYDAHHARRHAS